MIGSPVAHVTVLVYGLYSVRYMAKTGWRGFSEGGPSWAVDLTLPAVDVATLTAPLGMHGSIMPAALLGGFLLSIGRVRPPPQRDGQVFSETEQVQRWALGTLSMMLEVLTIPLMFGVLTSPQAPLYYWTAGMFTSLGLSRVGELELEGLRRRQDPSILTGEAQALLQRAAERVAEGAHEEALSFLKQARVLAPSNRSVHMACGDVLASLGNDVEAAAHYRRALQAQGRRRIPAADDVLSQRARFGLAMILSKDAASREEALELLERAAAPSGEGGGEGGREGGRGGGGEEYKPIAVRALLSIAALSEGPRKRAALARAVAIDPSIETRLRKARRKGAGGGTR